MTRARFLLLALATAFAVAAAAQKAPAFRHEAPLLLEGKGALYAVPLPVEVYRGIERRDLGDLRVVNGAGEPVPHALERQAAVENRAGAAVALAFFPLRGAADRPVDELRLSVERRPDGTVKAVVASGGSRGAAAPRVVGYLVDAAAAGAAVRELRFAWTAGPEGTSLDARLEASDDLRHWRPAGAGPLLVLRRGEALLERRAIDVTSPRAKFYRLSWRGAQQDPRLAAVEARLADTAADTPRAWQRFEAQAGDKPGEYVFDLPRGLPVDRVRFDLPQENTVVAAALVAQDRVGGAERGLLSTVLYRMEQRGQRLANPDLAVGAGGEKRWVLRVDARGGGLGAGLPALHAGWVPHRLLFVARGEPPFRAEFGDAEAKPGALPAASLVPGHATDKPVPALAARFGEIVTHVTPAQTPADAAQAWFETADRKKLWLWAALVAAVLVIVGMAWRLTREMP